MNLNGDSKAGGILHLEPSSAYEPILGTDEGMKKVARLHHLLIPLVVSFGDVKPGTDDHLSIRPISGKSFMRFGSQH